MSLNKRKLMVLVDIGMAYNVSWPWSLSSSSLFVIIGDESEQSKPNHFSLQMAWHIMYHRHDSSLPIIRD